MQSLREWLDEVVWKGKRPKAAIRRMNGDDLYQPRRKKDEAA